MEPLLLLKAAMLGVVEGLTEFLPISSTGHLIWASALLSTDPVKSPVFDIAIQTGAVLAILWNYRRRCCEVLVGFASSRRHRMFVATVVLAFLPAAVVGAVAGAFIKAALFKPVPVALALIAGGVAIVWVERRPRRMTVPTADALSPRDALTVGCVQCLALIPGTSRSAATILGGLLLGLSRPAATEFSFFLAVPTLLGAGAFELYSDWRLLSAADVGWFAVGGITAFASALVCIRWLLRFVATHNFVPFAWYRIVVGSIVLVVAAVWPSP